MTKREKEIRTALICAANELVSKDHSIDTTSSDPYVQGVYAALKYVYSKSPVENTTELTKEDIKSNLDHRLICAILGNSSDVRYKEHSFAHGLLAGYFTCKERNEEDLAIMFSQIWQYLYDDPEGWKKVKDPLMHILVALENKK